MKISVVVPVFNDVRVGRALDSILGQRHDHELEIVVVDAGSTDGTLDIVERYADSISVLISEPDEGIFDGLNKGIMLTSGAPNDIVHFLSADDRYGDPLVIRDVMDAFEADEGVDACYGDQVYTNDSGKVVRYWKAGEYRRFKLYYGWLPPHMTLFVRKRVYERCGLFDLRYPIAADQDFMLRLLFKHRINAKYLRRVLVDMSPGGNSTRSIANILKANVEVARAWRSNGMRGGVLVPVLKPARKLLQMTPLLRVGPFSRGRRLG